MIDRTHLTASLTVLPLRRQIGRAVFRLAAAFSLTLALTCAAPCRAQEPSPAPPVEGTAVAELAEALAREGFENVSVQRAPGGLMVSYENRLYRWEVTGLERVLALMLPAAAPGERLVVTLKELNVPFLRLEVSADDYRAFREGRLSPEELGDRLSLSRGSEHDAADLSSSFGRVDVTLGFGLRGRFLTERFGRVRGYQHRLRPGLEVALAKGLRLQAREWVPLNDKGFGSHPTPARFALDYHAWLGRLALAGVSVGRLQESVTGYRGDLVFFPTRKTSLQITLGRIGGSLTDTDTTLHMATLRGKLPFGDTYLVGRVGKFLGGDSGSQVGVATAFREREFGFFFTRARGQNQLLMTLRLPLWGQRYSRPGPIRPRFEEDFRFSYATVRPDLGRVPTDELLTNSWQDLELRDRLPEYLAFLRPDLSGAPDGGTVEVPESKGAGPRAEPLRTPEAGGRLQRNTAVYDERDLLGPSLYGTTGLLGIPAAEVTPPGHLTLAANFVDWKHRRGALPRSRGTMNQVIVLGVLPRVEVVAQFANVEGKPWLQSTNRFPGGVAGWNLDRAVHAQVLVLRESESLPAVALGWQDISIKGLGSGVTSTAQLGDAKFVVLSKHLGALRVHAGYGTDRLNGLFVGVDRPLLPWLRAIADYDTHYTNLGLRAQVLRHLTVDAYLNGSNGLGAGVAYRVKL